MPTTPRARSLKACSSKVIIWLPGQIQRRRLRSRRTEERPKKKGAVQGLRQKDKAQVSVVEYWIDAGGCQSRLRRAQRQPSLSCLRSIVASSGVARPFCGRHSSHQGRLPLDVYRYRSEEHTSELQSR